MPLLLSIAIQILGQSPLDKLANKQREMFAVGDVARALPPEFLPFVLEVRLASPTSLPNPSLDRIAL
jgi:hypothetical protein